MRTFTARSLSAFKTARLEFLKETYPDQVERMWQEGKLLTYLSQCEKEWRDYEMTLRDPQNPHGMPAAVGATNQLHNTDMGKWLELMSSAEAMAREKALRECVERPLPTEPSEEAPEE